MTKAERINVGTSPPTIRTTGITVAAILEMTASGLTAAEIVARKPALELGDVQAAVEFLGTLVEGPAGARGNARRVLGCYAPTTGSLPDDCPSSAAIERPWCRAQDSPLSGACRPQWFLERVQDDSSVLVLDGAVEDAAADCSGDDTGHRDASYAAFVGAVRGHAFVRADHVRDVPPFRRDTGGRLR